MKIIGITGGIGSGKSTVANLLSEQYSIDVINADQIAKEIMQRKEVMQKVKNIFGDMILNEDQMIDRAKLSEIVFQDRKAKQALEEIVHPLVRNVFLEKTTSYQTNDLPYVIYDCPLLIEAGLQNDVDITVLVYAVEEARIKRIMKRDHLPKEATKHRIDAQMNLEDKIPSADIIVYNTGTYDELKDSMKYLYQEFINYDICDE